MPLHPQAAAFLEYVASLNPPRFEDMTPAEARAFADIGWAAPASGVTDIEDIEIPGPLGPLRLRIHRPKGATGPLPVLVFFHGGGWVVCSFETHDYVCEELAVKTPAIVVSVDYRLSPESQFPGPVDECYAATVSPSVSARSPGLLRSAATAPAGSSLPRSLSARATTTCRSRCRR